MRLGWIAALSLVCLTACASDGESAMPEASADPSKGEDVSELESAKPDLDCSKLSSTGLELGDVAPDLVLKDGAGNDVHLHDFCNDTVILIASEF